jgi:hypothetical protein
MLHTARERTAVWSTLEKVKYCEGPTVPYFLVELERSGWLGVVTGANVKNKMSVREGYVEECRFRNSSRYFIWSFVGSGNPSNYIYLR